MKIIHINAELSNGWKGECDIQVEEFKQAFNVARDLVTGLYPDARSAKINIFMVAEVD